MLVTNSRFCNTYLIDGSDVFRVRNILWKNQWHFLDKFPDKAALVVSCKIYPFYIPSEGFYPETPIMFGNGKSDTLTATLIRTQYAFLGSPPLAEFTFNDESILTEDFMEYSTITEYKIFLPYFGEIEFDYNLFKANPSINIKYFIEPSNGELSVRVVYGDILSYENTKSIGVDSTVAGGDTSFSRRMLVDTITGAISAVSAVLLPVSVTKGRSKNDVTRTRRNPDTGRQVKSSGKKTESEFKSNTYSGGGRLIGDVMSGLSNLNNSMQNVSFTKSSDGSGSFYNGNYEIVPYILYKRPTNNYNADFLHMLGRPCCETNLISEYTGFIKCTTSHIESDATSTEIEEIEELLIGGVLINA